MNEENRQNFESLMAHLVQLEAPSDHAAEVPEEFGDTPIRALLYSLLRYDASPSQALNAISRIRSAVVDLNELRIAYPDEIAGILGPRYPKVFERSERIRAVLCSVFDREHEIALSSLYEVPKREARIYLESLEGITPYAAHRVGLCEFSIHCVPLDTKIVSALIGVGVFDKKTTTVNAASSLERAIRATDSLDHFLRLEAWAESGGEAPSRRAPKKTDEPKASITKGP